MAYCNRCGTKLDDAARFCSNCGRHLAAEELISSDSEVAADVEFVVPRINANLPGFVEQVLHPAESVLGVFSASLIDHRREEQLRHDKFVLTSERIILYHTSLIHKGMAEMPYKAISGVSYSRGWFHGKVIIEGPNVEMTMAGIGNDDAAFAEMVIASCVAGRRLAAAEPPPRREE